VFGGSIKSAPQRRKLVPCPNVDGICGHKVARRACHCRANPKMNIHGNKNIAQYRPQKPSLGRGAVRRAIGLEFRLSALISTGDVARRVHCKRTLIDGRKIEPHHYRYVRRILASLADAVARKRGRGRSWLWKLK